MAMMGSGVGVGAVLLVAVATLVAAGEVDELALFRAAFEEMDSTHDGKIDRAELEQMLADLGLSMTEAELQELMAAMAPPEVEEGGLSSFAAASVQYQQHAASGCTSAPCANGGLCQSRLELGKPQAEGEADYVCACTAGWAGENCAHDIDECASKPCENRGECLDSTDPPTLHHAHERVAAGVFRCLCPGHWSGARCEEDGRDCHSQPCRNGGGCSSRERADLASPAFSCSCSVGFIGDVCELDISECASGPCANGGMCAEPTPGHYLCQCALTLAPTCCAPHGRD